jgi:hypothetical protein
MDKSIIRSTFPYFVGLVVAAVLFFFAQQIEYAPRPGLIGPDFWPKAAIGLMAMSCLFELMRAITGAKLMARGVSDVLENIDGEEQAATYPWLLVGGIVLVIVYAVVVDILGFLLSTFLFLAAFMYLGRYRKHVAVWSISAGVTLLAALIFIRLAYVSLPRGEPPFDAITDFIRAMLGG